MKQINNLELFVGNKDEIELAKMSGMNIVNAIRQCKGYETHQSAVGWSQRGCPKDSPYYHYKETDSILFLNLVDTNDMKYIPDVIINKSNEFIDGKLKNGEKVFICCSLGESRSPSLALIYLLKQGIIDKENCINTFRSSFYEKYNPKQGFIDYINFKC